MRLALSATFTTYTESSHVELRSYKDRDGRTLANDRNPEAVVAAYPELFRVLKPDSFCVTFYGYPKLGASVPAWRKPVKRRWSLTLSTSSPAAVSPTW